MIAAGVAAGRKKSKTNPKMDPFIFTYSRGLAVFDIAQTLARIDAAAVFLKEIMDAQRSILIVGSQPAARDLVQALAERRGFAYVVNRWIGGLLTNFKTISERIAYFKKLKADKASGALEKYTKKERLEFDRLMANMAVAFGGVQDMPDLPGALVVVDALAHDIAVREAKRMRIPVVAVMSNDNDPSAIAYPIPANDNTRSSVAWILNRIESKLF
jgi:small subunit ribosomal protein S2